MQRFKRPASRKIAIKFAALDCFLENGFAATSMSDIRKRSGATIGSIYHFYAGKGALALELVEESIASWRDATLRLTSGKTVRAEVCGAVIGLLDWARKDPGQFRFMDEARVLAQAYPELADCAARLADGDRAAAARYGDWMGTGEVRPLAWPVAHALMLGPAFTYARGSGFVGTDPADDVILADAAWAAVASENAADAAKPPP